MQTFHIAAPHFHIMLVGNGFNTAKNIIGNRLPSISPIGEVRCPRRATRLPSSFTPQAVRTRPPHSTL